MNATAQADAVQRPGETPQPLLRIRELSKYFGDFCAVDNISLDIREGEFLTFLGASGSGKSTTLFMVAGFEQASGGEVELEGRSLLRVPPHKRDIGMVFQRYSLFPHMNVRENVGFPLSVRGYARDEIEQRVDRLLNLVQLDDFGERRPAQLSGGQQQRVAVARGLAYEPKLLLMDEPLSALDKRLREEMQYQLRSLHERLGFTVLYVTHDQEEALRLSDRIAVFDHGRIVQVGTGVELYERPASAFVAAFVGNSNFLRGRVRGHDGHEIEVALNEEENAMVRAPSQVAATVGQEVLLMVRPERMRLVSNTGTVDANALPVKVREKVYLGDNLVYEVTATGGQELRVKRSGVSGVESWQRSGQEAMLCWQPGDTHIFTGWNESDIAKARSGE